MHRVLVNWCGGALTAVVAAGMASPTNAATRIWTGGGTTGAFSDALNWDTLPSNSTTTDLGNFTAAYVSGNQPTMTAARSIASLLFNDGAGGWNLDGSFTLNLGTSGVTFGTTADNTGNITVAAPLSLGVNNGTSALRATGTGTITVDGIISGAAGRTLLIGGSVTSSLHVGTVILTGANTHAGTAVGSGTLRVLNTTAHVGDVAVTTNSLGAGGVTIGNGFAAANGNSPRLEVLVNGQDDATTQVITYGNGLLSNDGSITSTVHIGRASSTGTNKVVEFGTVQISVGSVMNLTAANGYNYKLGVLTTRDSTSDTGGFLINPTGTSVTAAGITSAARADRTNVLQLGGDAASTGNVVTGMIQDNNGRSNTIGINKVGDSVWRIQAANNYTGQTAVTAGTLKLDTNAQVGFGGYVIRSKSAGSTGTSVAAAGTLDLAGAASVNEQITLTGTLTNSSASTATVSNGIAAITTAGGGAFNAAPPSVSVTGGGGTGATAEATLGYFANNFTLTGGGSGYGSDPFFTITEGSNASGRVVGTRTSGVVTGLNVTGAGIGFTPGAAVTATVSSGTASITVDNTTLGVSAIRLTSAGSGYSTAPTVTVGDGSVTATAVLAGVVLSGTTATVGGIGNINLDGVVTGSGNLTKIDNNTVRLANANTYTGTTNVNGGTLLVTGTHTGASHYNISAGSLTGNATISLVTSRSFTVNGTGSINPGTTGAGALAINVVVTGSTSSSVDLSGGGTMVWQLTGLSDAGAGGTTGAGVTFDQLQVGGTDTGAGQTRVLLGGTSKLVIDLGGLADPNSEEAFWDVNHVWKVIDVSGTVTTPSNFAVVQNAVYGERTFSTYLGSGANAGDVFVAYQVPEPASLSLIALGAGLLHRTRRRS